MINLSKFSRKRVFVPIGIFIIILCAFLTGMILAEGLKGKTKLSEVNPKIKGTWRRMFCEHNENPSNCYTFLESLFKESMPLDIVSSNEKLEKYFRKNLNHLSFEGISRGKFNKNLKKEIIITSFKFSAGKHFHTCAIIIQKEMKKKWQAVSFHDFGYFERFINQPFKLIKDEPEFFIVYGEYMGGTCVPIDWHVNIYRLENNHFKHVWESVYQVDGVFSHEGCLHDEKGYFFKEEIKKLDKSDPTFNFIERLDADVKFKDLDKDGNLEIIIEGVKILAEGDDCYYRDGKELKKIKEEKYYKVFKWDGKKQTFVKTEKK